MGEGEKVMGKSLDEVIAALPAARRRRIEAHAAELIAEEMTLRELRKAMGKTQAQLARRLGKPQAAISRMEAQSDMLMSTLGEVVAGLGGRVRVVAELPGRAPVHLSGLGDLGTVPKQTRRAAAGPAKAVAGTRPLRSHTAKAKITEPTTTPPSMESAPHRRRSLARTSPG
jgi:ParB-like chromosome segregation protein Spo0J